MTPLAEIIAAQIRADGPMSMSRFMALCLGHPAHGYYTTRDPLGAAGDFTTAPEISQMFGEMIGLWLAAQASQWPDAVLVELGPGRGTLMQDARRAAPALGSHDLWLIETSPALRAAQRRRLPGANWAARLDELPRAPMLLVANEFFDALPVRQYLATPEGWRELQVGLDGDRLGRGLSAPLPGQAPDAGDWHETSPAAEEIAGQIAARIAALGGAALIFDYGYRTDTRPPGPTLQALRRHAPCDPLAAPGEADLTWLIDFDMLEQWLTPLTCHHGAQGAFLAALGIGHRAAALAGACPEQADAIADALDRLTAPDRMGTLFRVLAATAPGMAPPLGFAPGEGALQEEPR